VGAPAKYHGGNERASSRRGIGGDIAMSASAAKSATKVMRELDVEQLLERRVQQDAEKTRGRRIARARRLWTRRKMLGKFIAWGAVVSVLIAIVIPTRYASTTRLMPPDPPQGQGMAIAAALSGRLGGGIGALGSSLLGMNTSADLFAEVILSRTVQDELINKFDLRKVYGTKRMVDTRKELTQRTDISIDRKSGVLTIQVTDHEPKRASAMAQEYVAQLDNVVTQLNTSSAHRERVFLEERLTEVKQELKVSEKEFSEFSSKNGTIDIKEQGKAMLESAAVLAGQLIAARTEMQGLRQIYTDNNVRVRAMQARVNELERQIRKVGGADESKDGSGAADDELYPSIRKLPLLGVTYADLFRRTKVEETVFETLTQQYELAKVQEAKEVPSVKVLDPAEMPEKKVFPPRALLVLTGTMLALALGAAWIFATDGWKRADPQDPGKLLVLEMVRSVEPQIAYVTQQRFALSARTRKFLDRLDADTTSAETEL
jgi:capsule polysaccharide export protein KpsE/RkpR